MSKTRNANIRAILVYVLHCGHCGYWLSLLYSEPTRVWTGLFKCGAISVSGTVFFLLFNWLFYSMILFVFLLQFVLYPTDLQTLKFLELLTEHLVNKRITLTIH